MQKQQGHSFLSCLLVLASVIASGPYLQHFLHRWRQGAAEFLKQFRRILHVPRQHIVKHHKLVVLLQRIFLFIFFVIAVIIIRDANASFALVVLKHERGTGEGENKPIPQNSFIGRPAMSISHLLSLFLQELQVRFILGIKGIVIISNIGVFVVGL